MWSWCSKSWDNIPNAIPNPKPNWVLKGHKHPFHKSTRQLVRLLHLLPWLELWANKAQVKVTLLYGSKDLWGPWVPQWESCSGFQAQPHGFQDIWHILSSSCDTPGQLPWNQHKANDNRNNLSAQSRAACESLPPRLNCRSVLGDVRTEPHNSRNRAHASLGGYPKTAGTTAEHNNSPGIRCKWCFLRAHVPWSQWPARFSVTETIGPHPQVEFLQKHLQIFSILLIIFVHQKPHIPSQWVNFIWSKMIRKINP